MKTLHGLTFAAGLLCLLAGCAAIPADPVAIEERRARAEERILARDYDAAAAELAFALRQLPGDSELHLRHGEVLQAGGRRQEALAAYEQGRKIFPAGDARRQELSYRAALLAAVDGRAERASELLAELPEGSIPRRDLLGVIALQEGRGRDALLLFNEALQQGPGREMAARILYHAALAYHQLGDEKNTYGSLYRAVNLAEGLGLTREIEVFFNALSKEDSSR